MSPRDGAGVVVEPSPLARGLLRAAWLADIALGEELVRTVYGGNLASWAADVDGGYRRLLESMPLGGDTCGGGGGGGAIIAIEVFLGELFPHAFPNDRVLTLCGRLAADGPSRWRAAFALSAARHVHRVAVRSGDYTRTRVAGVQAWSLGSAGPEGRASRLAFDRALAEARIESERGFIDDIGRGARLRALTALDRGNWEGALQQRNVTASRIAAFGSQK